MKINYTLSAICFSMVLFQAPFIYYYNIGLLTLVILPAYIFIGLILTAILFIRIYKINKQKRGKVQMIGLYAIVIIGTASLFLEDPIEFLDWNLRKSTRMQIVDKVIDGELKPNVSYNNAVCSLHDWKYPPISNGGNNIIIEYGKNKKVTIEFFINAGFLDHYSAFVYTNDIEKIKELEDRIKQKNNDGLNKKLSENWYRVSY